MSEPSGWECCPIDVMMIIFEVVDIDSLARCFDVNVWWRQAVDYFAQHKRIWTPLARTMMSNHGVTFIRKSLLDWRDLYRNYQLWHQVKTAQIVCDQELAFEFVNYVDVYKDLLTVVFGHPMEKPKVEYFKITQEQLHSWDKETNKKYSVRPDIETLKGEYRQYQETTALIIQRIIEAGPFARVAVVHNHEWGPIFYENAFYGLDLHNNLTFYELDELNTWNTIPVTKYYGSYQTLDSLEEMDRWTDNLCAIGCYFKDGNFFNQSLNNKFEGSTATFYRPHKLLHSEKIYKKKMSYDYLKVPMPDSPAFVKSGKKFVGVSIEDRDEVRWVGEYPDLTSATQHGDMLFLGFDDGRVEIYRVNFRVRADPSPPKITFNLKDYIKDCAKKNHKIIVIEVFELEDSHHLFIATSDTVYRLLITYPKEITNSLGMTWISEGKRREETRAPRTQ